MHRAQINLLSGLYLALFAISSAATCQLPSSLSDFVIATYGERTEFDVVRNGKTIGEHVTTFTVGTDGVRVESNMQLGISILFVPVYSFEYRSRSQWCDQRLLELEAKTNDNGEVSTTRAAISGNELQIQYGSSVVAGPADLIPTNHWNPQVRKRRAVLNTITGQINSVTIEHCASGSELIERAAPQGECYEYAGDLQTRVWYTPAGRWVGLEFEAGDGSTISYVCRDCGAAHR